MAPPLWLQGLPPLNLLQQLQLQLQELVQVWTLQQILQDWVHRVIRQYLFQRRFVLRQGVRQCCFQPLGKRIRQCYSLANLLQQLQLQLRELDQV